jgi:GTPase
MDVTTPQNAAVKEGPVVAVDGPAGAGKSTVARRLAEDLGLAYINTGSMYRALASRSLARSIDPDDEVGLAGAARSLRFSVAEGRPPELRVDLGEGEPALESPEVESIVSAVARHPQVRGVLRTVQRLLGASGSVMEGRDIGAVVFPDADVKIFLSAPPGIRADRREMERGDAAAAAVGRRDAQDTVTNPLEPAPGSVVLDTTELSAEETFEEALRAVRARLPGLAAAHGPPRVAIIGRPNVGKSTLLNRLTGRREAIAHEIPGVTRDRLERTVRWDGTPFVLVDTGGMVDAASELEAAVVGQAVDAARRADLILLVVDATTGIMGGDERLAADLRRSVTPVLVVANKVDSDSQEPLVAEFHGLGLGEPLAVSALHGRRAGDLLDRIVDMIPEGTEAEVEGEPRFCVVGRPNVGKSSLFNRLVRQERAVVHREPGTTRDAIDSVVEVGGRAIRFVDTAGFRRAVKTRGVEYYGLIRSVQAIDAAHVALLVVDASERLTAEDKRIAARVAEAGRGLVAVLNKWDLVPGEERDALFVSLSRELSIFPGTPVQRSSALTGLGVGKIIPALLAVHRSWTRRVPTSDVNRVLEAAVAAHPPPRGSGRIKYGTQVSAAPPTFVLFGGTFPGAGYQRYLENVLRREFGFDGVPVRVSFRAREGRRRARTPGGRRGGGPPRPSRRPIDRGR